MDVMMGLAAASQALDAAKKLRDLEKDFDAATFKMEIANLMVALSDTKIALSEARETIAEKDAEIRRLSTIQASQVRVVKNGGFSFGVDDGIVRRIPFCPTCEQNGKQNQFSEPMSGMFLCPVCHRAESALPFPPSLPA